MLPPSRSRLRKLVPLREQTDRIATHGPSCIVVLAFICHIYSCRWYQFPNQGALPDPALCHAQGCCWDPSTTNGIPSCFYPDQPTPAPEQCEATDAARVNCYPQVRLRPPRRHWCSAHHPSFHENLTRNAGSVRMPVAGFSRLFGSTLARYLMFAG